MSSPTTVVLGGSSGIGLAVARRALARGHRTVIAGRDEQRLAAAAAELPGAIARRVDAADPRAVAALFAELKRIDHLVLAFGSRAGLGPFRELDLASVRAGFEEKVFPQLAAAQAALPVLAERGTLTFVTAISARMAMPGTAGIGAANAALEHVVPILAAELAPLRVNAVSPGVIDTPWWDVFPAAVKDALFAQTAKTSPVRRAGRADDVARVVEALWDCDFVTGSVYEADGGARVSAASV